MTDASALGAFSNQAIKFAETKTNLRLINGNHLVDLVVKYYEEFDPKYKTILPLSRVYVPQPVADGEE